MNNYIYLLIICLAGVAIYAALNRSGFFSSDADYEDRNPWHDKKINIKKGVVSRGSDDDPEAENFNLSRYDEGVMGPMIRYPSKLKKPFEQEKKK